MGSQAFHCSLPSCVILTKSSRKIFPCARFNVVGCDSFGLLYKQVCRP